MKEFLLWLGIVLTVTFFITSIVLFFKLKISQVISFYLKISKGNSNRVSFTNNSDVKVNHEITSEYDTMLLDMDKTELLNIAQNYATVLLDAENSTLSSSNKIEEEKNK